MADDSLEPEQPQQPQLDAPAQLGVSVLGMTGDPSTMANHKGIGPFVDNSKWNKPASEVGIHEKDIQDYVGKAKNYYAGKLQDGFPDLPDNRRQSLLNNFSSSLTNHVREYAIEKYAQGVNEAQATGDSTYIRNANIASMVPFVGTATDYAESSRREQAQKKIAGGEGEPYDFFTEGLNRARDRVYQNMPWYGKVASGTGHFAKFGAELALGQAAGVPGLGEAPAGTGFIQGALRTGAGFTALQTPGTLTGAFASGANPVDVAENMGKEFVNNTAFAGLAGLGKAREGVKGAFIGALKLMAAGEGAQDLTSGFGYLGQPGSLLRTLQAKTPEERSQALSDFFTSNAGPALLFEGAKHLALSGGSLTGKNALKQALKQEVTETTPAGSDINAPGTPISTEEAQKPTQEAVDASTGQGQPFQPPWDEEGGQGWTKYDPRLADYEKYGTPEEREKYLNQPVRYPFLTDEQRQQLTAAIDPLPKVKDLEAQLRRRGDNPDAIAKRVDVSGATSRSEWFDWARENKAWPNDPLKNEYAAALAAQIGKPEGDLHSEIFQHPEVKDAVKSDADGNRIDEDTVRRAIVQHLQNDSEALRAAAPNEGAPIQGDTGSAEAETPGAVPEASSDQLSGQEGGMGAMGTGPRTDLPPGQKVSAAGDVGDQEDHAPLADTMSVSRWQNFKDFWSKLSGATAPRMTRASTASSEKLAQLAAVPDYLRERLPNLIDQVIGKGATDEEAKVIGTTFQEMRHRAAKRNLIIEAAKANQEAADLPARAQREAANQPYVNTQQFKDLIQKQVADLKSKAIDLAKWADGISTFVGGEDSPLDSEETYQRYANSPKMKDFMQRWQQLVVPEMDKNTRSARGLEDTDPIDSLTQMPGFPMHAKAITEDSPALSSVGARRGNLQGMKLKRDPYQNRATLSSDRYDTDIRSIMEESLRKTTRNARLAEFYRTAESEGIGQWAPANAGPEGYRMVPNTRPPTGTQTAEPGDQFWIRGDLYDETHQAMGLDRPFLKLPFTNSATWWALQSTAEATYHAKNLLTGMFKPGMNPGDLFKNAYSVLTKDPWMQERMVELARIGAGTTKQSTFNPKNPMTYMGKMIDVMDRAVRLTAEDAWSKMLRTGATGRLAAAMGEKLNLDPSEAAKRDFVNQVAGNYNKLTQSRMVAWARDVGIGPFATAGTTYWANGVRSLVGGHGIATIDTASDLKLRATMLAKPLAILGAVMAYNYARWGRTDGDSGTPFGSMKLDTRDGKTVSWNPLVFTGLPRGIRSVGAMPALERSIHGLPVGENEVGKGLTNIGGSAIHPFVGPAGNFVTEGMTGHNVFGNKTAPDARRGQSQSWLNWKSALLNSNPILANVTGADNPYRDKSDWVEKGWKLLGPFGPQFRKPARR